ncbi:MAG: hypothetical protein E6494_06775 [Capnocytophaga sp.]|uniref:Uncharacterized protein n=1 Tax=Capnocytophaga ochracea (strain ATCC 27872 / DSM 7271 / CCUG 9716 / JCM 12966 / NCTC 12371 / SS31 / VPI 2845) TaxID=521097 RepID=C7M4Y7_CAPOD|nr:MULTISPECIES: hypothetical protein [Capnocytophaga]ACU91687.1 hypothetical protein Coch_0122 [Capnocytophaga ochracea DSM 7271]MDU6659798.1 hypothetical protein [Capnocytophaga sp.]UAK50463.1 hypothetical protein K8O87_06740 [Capnocytophaga ochracea]
MNEFIKALHYDKKDPRIPEEYDFFGALVGEWNIEWVDHLEADELRRVKGEWIFSWVLEGTAIQDVFIVPSRSERLQNKQPDAEYGTTLRIFNPRSSTWDIFYGCRGEAIRLTARTNEYGIRFHDKGLKATANGRYLFETFPASRNSLAIKPEWNNMTDIKQWQIKKGTLLFEGVAAPQGNLSGGQIQKFVVDDPVTSLI